MVDYFRNNEISFRLITTPNSGFRPGQLGSLHAVLSHFSVYEEPATLCLPTGYGKTAVMMALPFILQAQRVLVVEPSDALRKQTAQHFKDLSTLRKIGVAQAVTFNPSVLAQKGRPASAQEWEAFRDHDVVVSTPQSTSPGIAPDAPADLFDLIIFDEAHHAPADSWASYLEHFRGARFVFVTATPFRRDRKPIPGRLAYWYPVSKASREKAFGKVRFTSAPVRNDQDEEAVDRAVAHAAAGQLRRDRDAGFDHRIFARASSITAARDLVAVYAREGATMAAIASHVSKRRQEDIEAQLIDGSLDGVICVDMFGEGYDFPKLKIAALHAPHKSLVPTLQFIGRFARTNDAATGDATLVAPLSRLKSANVRLFQEGIDIAELIDDAAQEQIADAEANRQILDVLKPRRQADSDYDAVTPLLLELYAHARIFHCGQRPDFSLFKDTVGRRLQLVKQWSSDDGLIALLLTIDNSPPNWATSDVIANVRHDAFLLAFNEATNLCFIGSTRRTDRLYIELMQTACADQHRPISYDETRRVLAGLGDLRFYNLGLKNTALNSQAESYRVLTGPRAERAVTAGDGRAFTQGHFFGSGSKDDERETIGASSSSRVWSNQRLTVAEYLDWITEINRRLNSREAIAASQLDIVQHARVLRQIPQTIIAAGWNKLAYRNAPKVRWRVGAGPCSFGQITDLELASFNVSTDQSRLAFVIEADGFAADFEFTLGGGSLVRQVSADRTLELQSGIDDWLDLATWMSMHPPVFYAGDKSLFQGVNFMRAPANTIGTLAPGDTGTIDWDGCNIAVEWDATQAGGQRTVHQQLERHLLATEGLEVLVYDHRTGEAADYISLNRDADRNLRVSLYHCKGAGGVPSGGRVNDVYEVAGQLLKSIAYCDAAVLRAHVEHRANVERHRHPSRFVTGDLASLQTALRDTPANKVTFEIYGVQPGISKAQIDNHLADLMAFGLDYVHRGGAAKACWLVNA